MITCAFEDGGKASLRHLAVHAIMEKDGCILLEKRAPGLLEAGKWSIPSGYLDRDETASQGIIREVREETGWEASVSSLLYIKTDPNRPHEDRQNVAIFFVVTPIRKVGEKDHESTEVAWVPISELPPLDTLAFDHGEAIALYLRHKNERFPLPVLV